MTCGACGSRVRWPTEWCACGGARKRRAAAELTHAHAVAEAASTLAVQVGESAAHLSDLRDDDLMRMQRVDQAALANGVTQTELLLAQAQLAAYEAAREARERYEAERARREAAARWQADTVRARTELIPMITYGTNPGMGMPIDAPVPTPANEPDFNKKIALDKALSYMDLQPGQQLLGKSIDVVFIGSCTNSRISDLRQAAQFIEGRKVADSVRMMVVPGSQQVKKQAESEGLDRIFQAAGAEWREAGCSMCIAMNGDQLQPGQYAVSTSNRNFEGRQGKGGRTFLASPLTAAASAVNGAVTDPRTMLTGLN